MRVDNKSDVFRYFGGAPTVAKLLGISPSAVYMWGEVVPERRWLALWRASSGALQLPPAPLGDMTSSDEMSRPHFAPAGGSKPQAEAA